MEPFNRQFESKRPTRISCITVNIWNLIYLDGYEPSRRTDSILSLTKLHISSITGASMPRFNCLLQCTDETSQFNDRLTFAMPRPGRKNAYLVTLLFLDFLMMCPKNWSCRSCNSCMSGACLTWPLEDFFFLVTQKYSTAIGWSADDFIFKLLC